MLEFAILIVQYSRERRTLDHWLRVLLFALIGYYMTAYLIIPDLWSLIERRHPALQGLATHTITKEGIPGDPINVAVAATEATLERTLLAAGWVRADPITLESSLRIATDSVMHRAYDTAPVSSLYYWGHRPDLIFEQMIGGDPRRRHHVRLWRSTELDLQGRPLWVGAATLDTRAGFSRLTGQITHHIAAAVDEERDKFVADLVRSGAALQWTDGFQPILRGSNGGGDHYYTDGRLAVMTLD